MYHRHLIEAVYIAERKARVESLVRFCEEAMTKSVAKNEQLYSFADETTAPKHWKVIWRAGWATWLWKSTTFWKGLLSIPMVFLKQENFPIFRWKPLLKPSMLLGLSIRPLPEFLRHPASDNGNFSLQNTDAKRLNNRTKVCCVWLNRSKNLTSSGSSKKKSDCEKNKHWCLLNWRKIVEGDWHKPHWLK